MLCKILMLELFVVLLVMLCGCRNTAIMECQHCHEVKSTALRLVGNVDMDLCEECYDRYIVGEWGEEF